MRNLDESENPEVVEAPVNSFPSASPSDYVTMGLYAVLFVFGTALNGYVFVKLIRQYTARPKTTRQHNLKSSFTLLKLNVTSANILVCSVVAPWRFGWLVSYRWLAGDFMCKLAHFFFMFTINYACYTIVSVAVDRALVVRRMVVAIASSTGNINNVTHDCTRTVQQLIAFSVVFSVCTAVVQWFVWGTLQPDSRFNWEQCVTVWQRDYYLKQPVKFPLSFDTYEMLHQIVVVFVPFFIIALSYGYILNVTVCSNALQPRYGSFGRETSLELSQLENSTIAPKHTITNTSATYTQYGGASSTLLDPNNIEQRSHSTAGTATPTPKSSFLLVPSDPFSSRNSHTHSRCSSMVTTPPNWRRQIQSKMFYTAGLIIGCYLACFLPYNILAVISIFDKKLAANAVLDQYFDFAKQLIFYNSLINPFIYGFRDD